MEAMEEKRIWQRVRGTEDRTEQLRGCLEKQGALLESYRQLSRRGGGWRRLYEEKQRQSACLRGLLRLRTGQNAARPRQVRGNPEPDRCFAAELALLEELSDLSRDPELGQLFARLRDRQRSHCLLLLELLGQM